MLNYFPDEVCIGLQEIPQEISLIIPLAGCGHNCLDCHSPHYQIATNGEELTIEKFKELLDKYKNKVSCICFFSGEHEERQLLNFILLSKTYNLKTALYSGFELFELEENFKSNILIELDYLKTGQYIRQVGGLDCKTTNQKLWEIKDNNYINITKQFWRHHD
jgi:anaerobic ribonucleoside-triphosphate reductase activating protein